MKTELSHTLTAFTSAFKTLKPLATASYATAKTNTVPFVNSTRNATASLLDSLATKIKAPADAPVATKQQIADLVDTVTSVL